ncbi:MAG: succinylglutamate desuccinylase/aspartoacylase family protein [Planctomycetota bacterium]|nr:succinylglutamate desuccinylase/aspartoacylase family protein [Planctomycetota bacterium]
MGDERCIGDIGSTPGPWLIAVGGIHGNEAAGVTALERVFAELCDHKVSLKGRLIGFRGNIQALEKKVRYLDEDLNRLWTDSKIEALSAAMESGQAPESAERHEQHQLIQRIEALLSQAPHSVSFVDLHTMSGTGNVFAAYGNTSSNRQFAKVFPIEQVLDIGQHIKGAMLGYFCQRGYASLGFEAGQHDDPGSIERHRALIYLALDHLGVLDLDSLDFVDRDEVRSELSATLKGPRLLDVVYRHAIEEGDDFRMQSGWANFMAVKEGEQLATDRHGPVLAPYDSYMLLPLYQGQGSDGFFLVKEV